MADTSSLIVPIRKKCTFKSMFSRDSRNLISIVSVVEKKNYIYAHSANFSDVKFKSVFITTRTEGEKRDRNN